MANDIYSFRAKMITVIRIELIGQITVCRTVIHAGVVDKMRMQLFVASFSYKEITQTGKACRPVRVAVNDQ
jgi:hypothetical protein